MTIDQMVFGDKSLGNLLDEIVDLYQEDKRPWVIGYSGGKDSTSILRLVYEAAHVSRQRGLPLKPIFVVSSDTLVETPVVVSLIGETLAKVQQQALADGLPISVAQVTPKASETFWVNLIGKGYPAPTKQFRWCTDRMKIDPISEFIRKQVAAFGEVIVVLGSRSAESASRAQVIKKHKIEGRRVARHASLINAFVYTPIETWSADDVWEYLFSSPPPWGGTHQALLDLYKDSNAGECPLVIDKTTPSCGNSRFGCWVCTVVTEDRAMDGLIESGHKWLVPLKDFRDQLYQTTVPENKAKYRNLKGRLGQIKVAFDEKGVAKSIPGPYRMEYRKAFLRQLLQIQHSIRQSSEGKDFQLISLEELEQIRMEWRRDPVEPQWDDPIPKVYREVFGEDADWLDSDDALFSQLEMNILDGLETTYSVPKELVMKLLELELSMDGLARRSQLFQKIASIMNEDWGDLAAAIADKGSANSRTSLRTSELARFESLYKKWSSEESSAH